MYRNAGFGQGQHDHQIFLGIAAAAIDYAAKGNARVAEPSGPVGASEFWRLEG